MKDISETDIANNLPLVTRQDFKREVKVGDVVIGGKDLVAMAGPCTIEGKSQIFEIAKQVKEAGAKVLRGGAFKPLTFPYGDPLLQPDSDSGQPPADRKQILSTEELFKRAEKRLAYLKDAGEKYNLPVISEIIHADSLDMMCEYVDMFQIGYRHMFNMDLIEALSKTDKPLMIKRHYGESLRSLLGVAEHFEARGKHNFVICERGVSVPHTHKLESRAILDVQIIPALKEYAPSVPVIIDPSHATFKRSYVPAMSMAGVAAGADGLLIEVHFDPENAWVDPLQALSVSDFKELMGKLERVREIAFSTNAKEAIGA
jgi:3-deoxy-7-phosphoheptulonate synthase